MNKILTVLVSLFFVAACQAAPQEALSRFYARHQSDSNVQQINVPGFLLRFCSGDPDLKSALSHMRSLKVFKMEGRSAKKGHVHRDLDDALDQDGYEEALSVSDEGEKIRIMIREDGKMIKNVLITIDNAQELLVLKARTKLTYEQLGRMLNSVQTGKGKSGLRQLGTGKS